MTNLKQKKKSKFSVIAGITGAVVGAGAAVAGALALRDKKNRDKVKKVLNKVKDEAMTYAGKIGKEVKKDAGIVSKKAATTKRKIKKVVKKDVVKGVKKI